MGNPLRSRLRERACVNGWSMWPSPLVAETFAQAGWDSITFDMQHGLHDYMSVVQCLQAIQKHPVTPLVRVPWNEPGIIGKVLDAGAWGLICPMVNTAADAAALVQASLYPPVGSRSFGPVRAYAYGDTTPYHAQANDEVLILPQIETRQGVDNVEAILDTPGIGGLYVGPSDLGLSMGLPPILDREEPEMLEIYRHLLEQTAKRGLVAGIQNAAPAYAVRMVEMGFRLVTVANDIGLFARAAAVSVADTRGGLR